MSKRNLALVAYIPVVAAVAVALVQLYLTSATDLSRWKGGGFGMYTDPHPNQRGVWLAGDTTAVRLYPLDGRFAEAVMDDALQRQIRRASNLAGDARYFPSLYNSSPLASALSRLLQARADAPALALFPSGDGAALVVVDLGISSDLSAMEAKTVSKRALQTRQ